MSEGSVEMVSIACSDCAGVPFVEGAVRVVLLARLEHQNVVGLELGPRCWPSSFHFQVFGSELLIEPHF